METKNMVGGGIGVLIGGLLSTMLGLGPIGAIIGALLGGLGGSFLAGKIDSGPSSGRELGKDEPAPIKYTNDAVSAAKTLNKGDERLTAGLEADAGYKAVQDSAYTTIRSASATAKDGSQIIRETDKFRNKYRDTLLSTLKSGETVDTINNMNLADMTLRVNENFDQKLREQREKLKGYADYSSYGISSPQDAVRSIAAAPAGLTVGLAATPLAKSKIEEALKAYDSGEFDKFREIVSSVEGDKWLGGVPRAIFTRKPIREYSDLLIEMKETMNQRADFFKDREQLLKVATAEVRTQQEEKARLAEAARQAQEATAQAPASNEPAVSGNLASPQTPAKPTQQAMGNAKA